MKYLITGGAGFIGSNFIHYMFKKYGGGIQIINLDKLTYAGNSENLATLPSELIEKNNYCFEQTDICDTDAVDRVFCRYKPDVIVNFAAESHVDRSIKDPQSFTKTNVLGTQVLLDAALKYKVARYHQISTDEVYGSLGDTGYFTESTPLDPRSPYSASKASADLLCNAYSETFQLPVTISRCSNNYGPYQFPEKLIPFMIHNLLSGKQLPIYGDGLNIRDWLHVYDHCEAIDLILQSGKTGEVYNIGGHNEWTNIDIVHQLIKTILDLLPDSDVRKQHVSQGLIAFVSDRKGHDRRYAIDPAKIKHDLNWQPTIMFKEGIVDTVKWYLGNEKWMDRIITGEYRAKRG